MATRLTALARSGHLRAAINTGNRALVRVQGDQVSGVSPMLARRLAEEIGVELEPVMYDGAGKVFDDADQDVWDVAFLAIDPMRAEKVTFTRPYTAIEATYAVRDSASLSTVTQVDRPGTTVLLSKGSAYDMYLSGVLEHAQIERLATPGDSFDAFLGGRGDAVAGVRETLFSALGNSPGITIMDDAFQKVEQAMALPGRNHPLAQHLDDFVARAIESGFVARARNGTN